MCDNLGKLTRYPAVSAPAKALGQVVEKRLVKWHSSRHGLHRGAALFYKPTTKNQIKRSHVFNEATAAQDARNYRRLALSQATGWHRIALRPLG